MPAACATTWSSRPRTPAAPIRSSSYEVLEVAIEAGATTLNIPDTVGYTTPEEFGALIARSSAERAGRRMTWSSRVHCHNDLGLATANTLAGDPRTAPARSR